MVAVEVEDCNDPVSGVAWIDWSGPVSEDTIRVGTVPSGMNCAWIFTVTDVELLSVTSGKENGLAFIGTPLMLVTISAAGAEVGSASE